MNLIKSLFLGDGRIPQFNFHLNKKKPSAIEKLENKHNGWEQDNNLIHHFVTLKSMAHSVEAQDTQSQKETLPFISISP